MTRRKAAVLAALVMVQPPSRRLHGRHQFTCQLRRQAQAEENIRQGGGQGEGPVAGKPPAGHARLSCQ